MIHLKPFSGRVTSSARTQRPPPTSPLKYFPVESKRQGNRSQEEFNNQNGNGPVLLPKLKRNENQRIPTDNTTVAHQSLAKPQNSATIDRKSKSDHTKDKANIVAYNEEKKFYSNDHQESLKKEPGKLTFISV